MALLKMKDAMEEWMPWKKFASTRRLMNDMSFQPSAALEELAAAVYIATAVAQR